MVAIIIGIYGRLDLFQFFEEISGMFFFICIVFLGFVAIPYLTPFPNFSAPELAIDVIKIFLSTFTSIGFCITFIPS